MPIKRPLDLTDSEASEEEPLILQRKTQKLSYGKMAEAVEQTFTFQHSVDLQTRLEEKSVKLKGKLKGFPTRNDKIYNDGGFNMPGKDVFVPIPKVGPAETISYDPTAEIEQRFPITEYCCANIDTLTAALVVGDACALNFANARMPGGGYRRNARAQEEDLCRLLPQLWYSLSAAEYPITPDNALLSRDLVAVRRPKDYALTESLGTCTIVTSAMPCGPRRPKSGWENSDWEKTVLTRMRAVLTAARISKHENLVLGAFGCGAFGNPRQEVARLFRELLTTEFTGVFKAVVFAIIDPLGNGNLNAFRKVFPNEENNAGLD